MDLNNLKRQHSDLGELILKIESMLKKEIITEKAYDISMLLAQLSGKISIHLSSEDKFLYPSLLKHEDQRIRNTANRFNKEMGDIAKVYTLYKEKYQGANKIKDNGDEFIRDTKALFTALKKRIDSENKELYPLLG